ncbi:MAG: L,D-transpeptidase, partial [Candidatus Komeilibacteria bacterium]|nr:L,D-transpeptidase [Candidatus Komeilibacteria bacterium]
DKIKEIITAPIAAGGPHIRFFDNLGKPKGPGFMASPKEIKTIYALSRVDLGGDGQDEIMLLAQNKKNEIKIYLYRYNGSLINNFTAGTATSTLRATSADDGTKEYIVIDSTVYNGFGQALRTRETLPEKISLPITINKESRILELPKQVRAITQNEKIIIIDLSEQKLSYYQDGLRIATNRVSTGRWGFSTPIGEFKVQNKVPRAYSRAYGLYMPYWMAFYRGQYGLHELPEWPNGYKEGENHLGTPVSHGCIRLGVGPAKKLYDWAEVGIKVKVQN